MTIIAKYNEMVVIDISRRGRGFTGIRTDKLATFPKPRENDTRTCETFLQGENIPYKGFFNVTKMISISNRLLSGHPLETPNRFV